MAQLLENVYFQKFLCSRDIYGDNKEISRYLELGSGA